MVAMGDRPIELSMARFLDGLGWREKSVLATSLASVIVRGLDEDAAIEARKRLGIGNARLSYGTQASFRDELHTRTKC